MLRGFKVWRGVDVVIDYYFVIVGLKLKWKWSGLCYLWKWFYDFMWVYMLKNYVVCSIDVGLDYLFVVDWG